MNKRIINFYKEMDRAKDISIQGLQMRKLNYKDAIFNDEKEIKRLKQEIEDFKKSADNELQSLAK